MKGDYHAYFLGARARLYRDTYVSKESRAKKSFKELEFEEKNLTLSVLYRCWATLPGTVHAKLPMSPVFLAFTQPGLPASLKIKAPSQDASSLFQIVQSLLRPPTPHSENPVWESK